MGFPLHPLGQASAHTIITNAYMITHPKADRVAVALMPAKPPRVVPQRDVRPDPNVPAEAEAGADS
jgi:hypothetical protein